MRIFDNNELQKRVDEVLFYIWDPIGVSHEPEARGEYWSYVGQVLELVEKNNCIEPISDHLVNIVNDKMGISADKNQCDHTAELLLRHKKAIKDGLA
jgi:hypothetical protein